MHAIMHFVYFGYAALLVAGGVMGFIVAKSPMSLVGSALFGLVAAFAGFVVLNGGRDGLYIGLVDAIAVAGFFVYRYLSGAKPAVAFSSIGLSVLVIALSIVTLVKTADMPRTL